MQKRILSVERPFHLSVRNSQLVLRDKENEEEHQRPLEDIGVLVLENERTTFTNAMLQAALEHNVAVVICDAQHMPSGLFMPLRHNTLLQERHDAQVTATEALKAKLWQRTVEAKIKNQALLLDQRAKAGEPLHFMATQVERGDATNVEARAAKRYWEMLFVIEFSRERYGNWPNPALNYGYAILRAAMARALVSAGLLPSLGIHHHNRYNPYCLADDIMEPYRPFVDAAVLEIMEIGHDELNKEAKKALLQVLHSDVRGGSTANVLMAELDKTAASLAQCYLGEAKEIHYPSLL